MTPEYDAFGNPVNQEPPESAFGASEPGKPTPVEPAAAEAFDGPPVPTPTPSGAPYTPPPTPPRPTPANPGPVPPSPSIPSSSIRVSRGGGCSWVGLIIALLVFGLPLVGGILVFNQVGDTVDEVTKQFDHAFTTSDDTSDDTSTDSGSGDSGSDRPDTPPKGVERGSMLRTADFSRAMRQIRRAADGGSPIFVRVEAERIDVQVRKRKGGVVLLHRPWDQQVESIGGTSSSTTGQPTLRWSQIDPAAPRRIFEAVRNGSTRPSKQLTYAVMFATPSAVPRRWSAFRKDGASYTAAPNGRDVQRTG